MLLRSFLSLYSLVVLALILAMPLHARAVSPELTVVYPKEGDTVQAGDSTYVFGHVVPAETPVFVNGIRAKKYVNGTFMAMVPVRPGEFVFSCLAVDGLDSTRVDRTVYIPEFMFETAAEPARFDTSFFFPAGEYELFPGDYAAFLAKTARGRRPFVHLPALGLSQSLRELRAYPRRHLRKATFPGDRLPFLPRVRGVYGTTLRIPENSPVDTTFAIAYTMSSSAEDSVRFSPRAQVRILDPDREYWGRIGQEVRSGLPGRKRGQILLIPEGTLVKKIARAGQSIRIAVSRKSRFWIPAAAFAAVDSQSLPADNSPVVLARSESDSSRITLRMFLRRRLPVTVLQTRRPQQVKIRLYGTTDIPDMLRQDFSDPILKEIRGRRIAEDEYEFAIRLNLKQQWGYRVYYDAEDLVLEIRKPPLQRFDPEKPFAGLLICLDPGHSPDEGATGPTGSSERFVTPGYARLLKDMLVEKGAEVMITRNDTAGVALAARTLLADAADADIFISLHFNSLPDGINPFPLRGSGVFYYTSQSYLLATHVNHYLRRATQLPNYGVKYQSLYVCRQTAMPSILLEPAFIMHPIEEMYILNGEFQRRVCEAVVKGLEAFLRKAL